MVTTQITVAIPTRGDRPNIAETIQGVLASAQARPFELLVVWSGQESPPPWSNDLPGEPRHVSALPLGLSVARNAALESASNDILLMPDDDVVCTIGWFDAMVSALLGGADIVGGPVICRWPNRRPVWLTLEMEKVFGSLDLGPASKDLVLGQSLVGGNMAMWRQSILALGGYDDTLGATGRGGGMGEENDLCDRALRLGLRVRYVADARVEHVMEAGVATRRNYARRMYRFGRSMAIVRSQEGPRAWRKLASATARIARAPFVVDSMQQLGSACFEIGSARTPSGLH